MSVAEEVVREEGFEEETRPVDVNSADPYVRPRPRPRLEVIDFIVKIQEKIYPMHTSTS